MKKNGKKNDAKHYIIDEFELPKDPSFLKNSIPQFNKNKDILSRINESEKKIRKYSHIFEKNDRLDKALLSLKYFSFFIYFPNAPFSIETTYEGLVLIFLLDAVADDNKYSIAYRKKFLNDFLYFIKNISSDKKITSKDKRQNEMQKIWLDHFKKIYYKVNFKQEKWIEATMDFTIGMINELDNKKYKTLSAYLKNAIPSSGALFYWQSLITEAGFVKQNNPQYDKLIYQIGKFLRLVNDYSQTKEDKIKITAINFYQNEDELKNAFEVELKKLQKMLKKSSINKKIRLALWRSAVFLYYFYQKNNFWGEI